MDAEKVTFMWLEEGARHQKRKTFLKADLKAEVQKHCFDRTKKVDKEGFF